MLVFGWEFSKPFPEGSPCPAGILRKANVILEIWVRPLPCLLSLLPMAGAEHGALSPRNDPLESEQFLLSCQSTLGLAAG